MPAFNLECVEDAPNATGPIIEDITEFCDFCVVLVKFILERSQPDMEALNAIADSTPDYGSKSCRFCEMISSARSDTPSDLKRSVRGDWFPLRTTSSDEQGNGRPCAFTFGGISLAVWADVGSAACTFFLHRSPIFGPSMSQVCALVQEWRKECSTHPECLPEAEMPLPTRILTLCGHHTRPSIRLLSSNGLKGRYIALSHCWGSTKKRPPRTTSENVEAQQAGTAFEDLPKTFQDVVIFAQAIGITYIWIDSLCIIQDDHQDWISEAAKMGDVYRNAALVVAASGAKDCSGGLTITDRPRARVFRLPFVEAGETNGTFNIMPLSKNDRNSADGPLEKRAWTLQERWLARRFISFMPQSITWKCKRGERVEAGGYFRAFTPRNGLEGPRHEWDKLLSAYTSRLLTVPSDRTEAIKGIAEEVQRSRKDEYLPECGFWTGGPISQLLWLKDGRCVQADKLSTVPSWSWAATESAKKWPEAGYPTGYYNLMDAEVPERLAVTTENQLLVSGHLSTTRQTRSHVQDDIAERELAPAELKQLYYWWNRTGQENHEFHVLAQEKDGLQEQAVLGIARFDLDGVSSYTHAGIFAKQKSWQTEGVTESPATEQIVNGVVYHIQRYPFCVYWALLLELVDGNRFRRVGMALLLPIAYEVFQVQVQDYEII